MARTWWRISNTASTRAPGPPHGGAPRGIGEEREQRVGERARIARRHEEPGLSVDDDEEGAALARRDHRTPDRHRLDQHAPERLGHDRGVDHDVHRVEAGGDVVAGAGQDHVAGEVRARDPLVDPLRVLGAAPVHAADEEAAELREARARARDRLDHEMLPLPVLDVPDDAGERRIGRDAELAPNGGATAGGERGRVDAVVDGEEPARAQVPRAAVRLDLLGHADAGLEPAGGEALERADALEALLVAHDRDAAAARGDQAVQVRAQAVGEVDERRPLAPEELGERARAGAHHAVEVGGAEPHSAEPALAVRARRAGERRQDVHGQAVGGDVLRLVERQHGCEAGAVEPRDQVEDAGERAPDHAAGARLDEQDAARRHGREPQTLIGGAAGCQAKGRRLW